MIDIHVDGRTYGNNGSGFAVILRSTSNIWKRAISHGNLSANQVELEAVKFALLSIATPYQGEEIKLHVRNKYVRDMLEKDNSGLYVKVAKANKEQIDGMREVFDKMTNITVMKSEGEIADECAELVAKAVKDSEEINEKQ